MLTVMLLDVESITRPNANMPAKMMPIDVSSLMPVRRATEPINRAITIPAGTRGEKRADSQQESDHHCRQYGVCKGVAHESAPTRDDVRAEYGAHDADENRDDQRPHHEAVLKRLDDIVDHDICPEAT